MNATTKQKAIDILTTHDTIVCPKLLEQFVWANTAQPKFKYGDPVIFSNYSTSIGRVIYVHITTGEILTSQISKLAGGRRRQQWARVERAVGRVTNIERSLRDCTFFYTIEYEVDLEEGEINGKTITTHTAHAYEKDLTKALAFSINKWSKLGSISTER